MWIMKCLKPSGVQTPDRWQRTASCNWWCEGVEFTSSRSVLCVPLLCLKQRTTVIYIYIYIYIYTSGRHVSTLQDKQKTFLNFLIHNPNKRCKMYDHSPFIVCLFVYQKDKWLPYLLRYSELFYYISFVLYLRSLRT